MEVKSVDPASHQHTNSCTECQRRKQKCSRQWPCNHCQARKIPHMCHFANKKTSIGNESRNGSVNAARKRKGPDHTTFRTEPLIVSDEQHNVADAMKALGYLQSDGDPLFFGMLSERPKDDKIAQANDLATKDVPPRIYCDAIVQNYFDICNYWYYPIYPTQFVEGYEAWWKARSLKQRNKPEFTCLLLRVLASSTQCVAPSLRQKLESELGESLQDLTHKYHEAAEKLSNMIPPGVGGVMQVQQLFLTAVWMKSESLFIDSWHCLNDAIRYAQEVGIHNEELWGNLSEFDCEIRRRLWTTLYIWDRFMGMMLSRPLIINERYCNVKHPMVNLEFDPQNPDLPCPHKHMELQQQLCEAVIGDFDGSRPTVAVKDAEIVITAVNKWLDDLPAVYKVDGADTRYDESHRYLVLQRLQTVCMGYAAILSVLKTFITRTFKSEPALTKKKLLELQHIAVRRAVQLMDIAQDLADLYIPDYNKYFLIVFTPFDTATLLCSAIIHDKNHELPRRNDILHTIAKGLSLIQRLAKVTRTGTVAEGVLKKLIAQFHLSPQEQSIFYGSPSSNSDLSSPPSTKRQATSHGARKGSDDSTPSLSPDVPTDNEPTNMSMSSASTFPPVLETQGSISSASSTALSPPNHITTAPMHVAPMTAASNNFTNASMPPNSMPPNSIPPNSMPPNSMPPTSMPPTSMPPSNIYANGPFPNEYAVQDIVQFDLGPMQPIFSWDNINLFTNSDQVFDFTPDGSL